MLIFSVIDEVRKYLDVTWISDIPEECPGEQVPLFFNDHDQIFFCGDTVTSVPTTLTIPSEVHKKERIQGMNCPLQIKQIIN
jgi:hypothetical protein